MTIPTTQREADDLAQKALAAITERLALTYLICCGTSPKQSVGELLNVTINMPEWEIVRAAIDQSASPALIQALETGDDRESSRWFDIHPSEVPFYTEEGYKIRRLYERADTDQPSAGQVDERAMLAMWADAYAAFVGAFDTPQMRRKMSDEYSADARKRLREFNDQFRASITPTAPQAASLRDAINRIADDLTDEAQPYEGEFADVVRSSAEALRELTVDSAAPQAATMASRVIEVQPGHAFIAPPGTEVRHITATTASASGRELYEAWANSPAAVDSVGRRAAPAWDDLAESTRAHWNKQALHGCAPAPSREDFDRLLGQYWEIAYDEGRTGESRGTEAQVVLTKLRAALARAPLPASPAPVDVALTPLPEPECMGQNATGDLHGYTAEQVRQAQRDAIAPYAERIRLLERELSEHKAARIAYASEFPLNADGEPDVGSIHTNIRALKGRAYIDGRTAGTATEHSWSRTGIYAGAGQEAVAALDIYGEATEDNEDELQARMAANAAFITACRDMVPELIAENERLRNLLESVPPPFAAPAGQHDVDFASLRLVQKLSTISMRLAADLVSGADYTFQGHDYLDRNAVVDRVMEWHREWDATYPARAELAGRCRAQGGITEQNSSSKYSINCSAPAAGTDKDAEQPQE